jgi:hypothetical protein
MRANRIHVRTKSVPLPISSNEGAYQRYKAYVSWCGRMGIVPAFFSTWQRVNGKIPDFPALNLLNEPPASAQARRWAVHHRLASRA